ncbi:helix-turn-helix domain-containing protein [Neorhizobium sp. AL 9.2.2]|uniref:helix-turn-helix domain-containing protein n=1 Tax=Neorhizobium sp. AL 9.2.2 TaxID=2712894 RepID=UPI00353028C6
MHARSLLTAETDNIAQFAYTVSYGSVSQFHREYKRAFGVTPRHGVILPIAPDKGS